MQLPLDSLARSYFLPFLRRFSSVLAAHYDAPYAPVSFPPFFNASHLIVTGVEAKHRLKNTNTVDLLSKTKTAGSSSGARMCWEEAECSKLCLFVFERMFLAGGVGGTSSSLAPSLQSLNPLPFWAPNHQQHHQSTSAKVLLIPLLRLCSPLPLRNYPGNCGVIDCITCSKETLALFNKQLEYAPHVVGEQEEEHIGAEGVGWSFGKKIGGGLTRAEW